MSALSTWADNDAEALLLANGTWNQAKAWCDCGQTGPMRTTFWVQAILRKGTHHSGLMSTRWTTMHEYCNTAHKGIAATISAHCTTTLNASDCTPLPGNDFFCTTEARFDLERQARTKRRGSARTLWLQLRQNLIENVQKLFLFANT